MSTSRDRSIDDTSNPSTIKDPQEWVTGDEPMTGAQDSYVHTLAREAGEDIPPDMTKAEASEKIDELQAKTGRGKGPSPRKTRRNSPSTKGDRG